MFSNSNNGSMNGNSSNGAGVPLGSTAAPSFWIQSSWRGDRTIPQVCANKAPDKKKSIVGRISLYALYGSWNTVPKADHSGLLRLLDLLLHPHARRDAQYTTGRVEIDMEDEDLERYCMESKDNTTATSSNDNDNDNDNDGSSSVSATPITIPCPPQHLPALLLIVQRASMKEPDVRYLSLSSEEILSFWNRKKSSVMQLSDAAQEEIRDCLVSFGLGQSSLPPELLSPASPRLTSPLSPAPSTPPIPATRIFIAGDRMSVGKTSVCLGLLGSLIRKGYPPESLAYIKPATQNEKPQLVQIYCERMGIPCVPVGPIVYYRGFTRAFLEGETDSTEEFLERVEAAVDELAEGKRVVIVDGVGFPAVGSICGTDNASVAAASGYADLDPSSSKRHPPGVLVVGGPGVGGAIDAFNLNAAYFERVQVPVLGAIFNKLSAEGFYSLQNCKKAIDSYFAQNEHAQEHGRKAFGFVPLFPELAGKYPMKHVHQYIQLFEKHVQLDALLEAAAQHIPKPQEKASDHMDMDIDETIDAVESRTNGGNLPAPPPKRIKSTGKRPRSRDEIEAAAITAGAAPSA